MKKINEDKYEISNICEFCLSKPSAIREKDRQLYFKQITEINDNMFLKDNDFPNGMWNYILCIGTF